MEKRLLLAIVLSFVILFVYQAFFAPKPPIPEQIPEDLTQKVLTPEAQKVQLEPQTLQEEPEREIFDPAEETTEKDTIIDTSLFRAVWSNRGGVLKSWRLYQHLDEDGEPLELISNLSSELKRFPFWLKTEWVESDLLDPISNFFELSAFDNLINNALYSVSTTSLRLQPGQSGEVRFEYARDDGTRVEKIFTFTEGSYLFDVEINVWNKGLKVEPNILWGPGIGNPSLAAQKNRLSGFQNGISVLKPDGRVEHHDERKYKPEERAYSFVDWAAFSDQYFTAMFFTAPQKSSALFLRQDAEAVSRFFLSVTNAQKAYIGPKEFDRLVVIGDGAKGVIRFGLFGFVSEILFQAMKAVHKAIPNWGLCIIIITFFVKIIFFPLTYSSTRSMSKMQELQPKIKALKAKYKKAKQDVTQRRKLNEETMKLYKEHGVNPAGGCLPILVQLPIFWGFFRLLMVSIEFRHSPFLLWITDLSVKDPFYVTPILMGITQYISQKMTPTSADPTQQRMMLIMPVIMTIFFMNFSSGLVLYWLTNNVLQIGQQYIMNRIQKKKKSKSHGKRRK